MLHNFSTSLLHARRTELNLKMLIKRYQQSSPLPKLITSFNEVKNTPLQRPQSATSPAPAQLCVLTNFFKSFQK